MPVKRLDRINEEVKKTLAEIVREVKDPRVSDMTTIVSADVTNDFKTAKIRVSVYDSNDEVRVASVDALNHASGFIARELGKRMQIRRLPQLIFILDTNIEYSARISQILNGLNAERKNVENDEDE